MMIAWRKLVTFGNAAQVYLEKHKAAETRLTYAIKRVVSQLTKLNDQVQNKLTDIEIDHCVTEARGVAPDVKEVICRDSRGQLEFTIEGAKARNCQQAEYLDGDNMEFEPHFVRTIPLAITDQELGAFEGIVIRTEDAKALRAKREEALDALEALPAVQAALDMLDEAESQTDADAESGAPPLSLVEAIAGIKEAAASL